METKFVIFYLTFFIGVPAGVVACAVYRPLKHAVMMLMIWATCVPESTGINFLSRESYRTTTRGFEVSLVDLCALIMLVVILLENNRHRIRWFPPLTIPYAGYIGVILISWLLVGENPPVPLEAFYIERPFFEVHLYPLFELSKIIRGCVVYFIVVNYARDATAFKVLIAGIGVTVLTTGYLSFADRYIHHVHRVTATLGDPNSLATYMAIMGATMFGMALYHQNVFHSAFFGGLAGLAGVSIILTISRGGLAAYALGLGVIFLTFLHRFFTIKNIAFIALGALIGVAVFAMAFDTLMSRFGGDAEADLEYRGLYNEEAVLMAQDHFFGVGIGNFSAYSWDRYARMVDPDLTPGTPAHHVWYLTLGELGIPGVIAFALIWIRFYQLTLRFIFTRQQGFIISVGIACVAATILNHVQNLLHMSYRQTPMYFMTRLMMGMAVAVWYYQREVKAQRKAAAEETDLDAVETARATLGTLR